MRSHCDAEAITLPEDTFIFVVISEVCCREAKTVSIFPLKKNTQTNPNLIRNNISSDFDILVFHFMSDWLGKGGPSVVAAT